VQSALVSHRPSEVEDNPSFEPAAQASEFEADQPYASPARLRNLWPWLKGAAAAILFVLLTLILVPIPRSVPSSDPDSSWCAVLNHAHARGWQFGSDVAFTYGPAGFLISPWTTGQFSRLQLAAAVFLSSMAAAALCRLAWRANGIRAFLPLGTVILLAPNIYPCADLLIYLGLLGWGTLCFVESGPMLLASVTCLTVLAAVIAPLKMTFMLLGGLTICAVVLQLLLQRRFLAPIIMVAGFLGAFAAEWLLLGQNFAHFHDFLKYGFAISAPYDQALAQEPLLAVAKSGAALGLASVALLIGGVVSGLGSFARAFQLRRYVLLAWMAGLLFLIWKHGFVRADRFHVGYFICFVPALVLCLEALPAASMLARNCVGLVGAACCVGAALTLQMQYFPGYLKFCAARIPRGAVANWNTLSHLREYNQGLQQDLIIERQRQDLPRLRQRIGTATVDMFGQNQSYCWYNDFNYRPRPVFQSYSVYSPPLAELNERFFLSSAAPDYALFALTPIDQKFAPLEDSLALRDLLANCSLADSEGPFLLLKRERTQPVKLRLIDTGELQPGQPLQLPQSSGKELWLQLKLNPSPTGRGRQLLYQAPEVQLAFWSGKDELSRYHAPPIMMEAGFIVSPLVRGAADVLALYAKDNHQLVRPTAVSLEVSSDTKNLWRQSAHYRIYEIEDKLGAFGSRLAESTLNFPGFPSEPTASSAPSNQVVSVAGAAAIHVPPGDYLKFSVPEWASSATLSHIYLGNPHHSEAASERLEFRVELESSGGKTQQLHSSPATAERNPTTRSLVPFSVPLREKGETSRVLVLRTIAPQSATPGAAQPLTCWANLRFQ
jgi:hypothetical protein